MPSKYAKAFDKHKEKDQQTLEQVKKRKGGHAAVVVDGTGRVVSYGAHTGAQAEQEAVAARLRRTGGRYKDLTVVTGKDAERAIESGRV